MEVTIKTLTPLWTGGTETGKCDRIHETGILGSLRWWMEVLVRGMGGNVCDPTEQKCSAKNGLCPVCQMFGAEGQKRRFRLEIQESQISDALIRATITANRTYTDKQGNKKTPTWYFRDPTQENTRPQPANTPKTGTFTLKIQSLHPGFKPEVIGGLIQFMADWSALGARPQMGFGVIQIEGSRIDTRSLYDWLTTIPKSEPPNCKDMPSLQNIFLATIQPKDSKTPFKEQDTFNLKYDLRQLFRTDAEVDEEKSENGKPRPKKKDRDKDLRHFIMGKAPAASGDAEENKGMAAKIKISRPYPYDNSKFMRIWGWIPEAAEVYKNGWDRGKIVNDIYQHLTTNYTLHDWREMDSGRDTQPKNTSNAKMFLHSLLKLQEDT